jgi:2-polyprenyl-6-methoxyphenol hydroxylase-like FAD-dependent oxidoreductase
MNQRSTVLIVGAGPCGLMAACELRRRGVTATVVDSASGAGAGSRAILLWPPSLELYSSLGIRAEAEKHGVAIKALAFHLGPGKTLRLPLSPLTAPLILPQQDTNRLLEDELRRLGGTVEWGVEVTAISAADDLVTATARLADGTQTRLEADWLIAADGVRSTVREQLGVTFAGEQLPFTFMLAEGTLDGDYGQDAVNYYLSRTGSILVAPLPGGRVRLSGVIEPDREFTPGLAQQLLDERGPGGLKITDLTMNTMFSSHERIAETFRVGRCLLIGDAAHTHSVVGGQGLNLGFGDANNLAWKLAGVIDGRFSPAILDSYGAERQAAAEQIIKSTGSLIRRSVVSPLENRIRNGMLSLAHRSGMLTRRLPPMFAGWLIHYPDTLFPAPRAKPPKALPKPGTRDPHWQLEPADQDRFQLVTLGPSGSPLESEAKALAASQPALLTYRHRGDRGTGFVLLRPDGFVAACGRPADLTRVTHSLTALKGQPQ